MTPYYADAHLTVYVGDCREVMADMPAESIHCVVTSPPYWGLRDYGVAGQLGLEPTPEEYVANLVAVFREVRRVLRADGTVWLNLGDSYAGSGPSGAAYQSETTKRRADGDGTDGVFRVSKRLAERGLTYAEKKPVPPPGLKPKDLVGIPWRVAFALQADGWYLRSDIVWSKPNPMPESVTDRPTKAHEYLFLLSKAPRYYYDAEAVRERAESGPSDLRKMAEGRERIGGLVKEQTDPRLKASALTNIGRKRSVGGKQLASAQASSAATERRMGGFNDRWDASENNGTAPAGRNLRSVWTIATQPYPGAHFATFPEKLVEPCVKAGCPLDGTVLDPFAGSGTVGRVANRLGRRAVLIDLKADYIDQAMLRNAQAPLGLGA